MKSRTGDVLRILTVVLISFFPSLANAQDSAVIRVAVGSGPEQLGISPNPNAQCLAPTSLAFIDEETILVLDQANARLSKITLNGSTSVAHQFDPSQSPTDFLMVNSGALVLDGKSEIAELYDANFVVQRSIDTRSEDILSSSDQFDLFSVSRRIGLPAGAQEAAQFAVTLNDARSVTFSLESERYEFSSEYVILTAQPLFINASSFIVLLEQTATADGNEVVFSRLVRWNRNDSVAKDDAFRPLTDNPCKANRYYAISPNGRAIFMGADQGAIEFRPAAFQPIGRLPILPDGGQPQPVASGDDPIFRFLEQMNGFDPTQAVAAIPSISRGEIIARARGAAGLSWQPNDNNVKPTHLKNECAPQSGKIWKLPVYLNDKPAVAIGVPYRWGGYFKAIGTFTTKQVNGHPAGDICTCRNAALSYCIVRSSPEPTGLDCSGFVSYAWNANNYFTTVRIPDASQRVSWGEIKAGDVVNKSGSHVRLVVGINNSNPTNPLYTVIESAVSCGKVCEMSYTKANLMNSGYVPYRRKNIQE